MSNKINSSKKIDQNFKALIEILNENKINYWVCHGTLLGIIRDNQLIRWDHDIDIGVIESKIYRKILPAIFKKKGFREVKKTFLKNDGMLKFIKDGGREIDINFYKINMRTKKAFAKWNIPRNLFMRIIDVLSFAKNYKGRLYKLINLLGFTENFFLYLKKILVINNFFYSYAGYSHHKKYILKLKKYYFLGLEIYVPNDYNKYLEAIYGKKWKTPVKKYNWIKHSPSTISLNK